MYTNERAKEIVAAAYKYNTYEQHYEIVYASQNNSQQIC